MDGNTRLCTATAAAALKESFGTDGQPGSYTDIDHADAIFLVGHNVAETQTVLWMRILDRRRGANPPSAHRASTRAATAAAAERPADVHLAPRVGHERRPDQRPPARAHRQRLDRRRATSTRTPSASTSCATVVEQYTPERVAEICDVAGRATCGARPQIFGTAERRALDRAPGLLPVAPGDRRGVSRSTTSTCCAA